MDRVTIAAVVFCVLAGAAVTFQLLLAAGKPWGHLAMGGRFPGRLPPAMRVAAVVQALVLAVLAMIVWNAASRGADRPSIAVWIVVAFSGVALVMNLLTPSRPERRLWAPVASGMLGCSLIVALA